MEVDTGASVSLMPKNRYHNLWPGRSLTTSAIRLQTYSKQPISVVGSTEVELHTKARRLHCLWWL